MREKDPPNAKRFDPEDSVYQYSEMLSTEKKIQSFKIERQKGRDLSLILKGGIENKLLENSGQDSLNPNKDFLLKR